MQSSVKPPTPGARPIDVLGVGHAIVDILAHVDDEFLADHDLAKGHMSLIDKPRASTLYDALGPAIEVSGGSSANTIAGLASLGGTAAFVGTVADDQLGQVFAHDLRAAGVRYETAPISSEEETARSIVVVTPDSQRTMNTYLGAAAQMNEQHFNSALFAEVSVVFMEGYIFDIPWGESLYNFIVDRARAFNCQVALSLSEPFIVEGHRSAIESALERGVDVLFANHDELLTLYKGESLEQAIKNVGQAVPYAGVTLSSEGSFGLDHGETFAVPAYPTHVVDTTGAGDLYAAGFLYGYTHGESIEACAKLGAKCAAEVISHLGARPQIKLKDFVASAPEN